MFVPTLNDSLGATEIGVLISTFLYAVLTVQVYIHYKFVGMLILCETSLADIR